MPQDIESIFRAKSMCLGVYMREGGQGNYIPAYQRHYSWDGENIDRLFGDVIDGLEQLLEGRSTISFLGTIIAIHDIKHQTVNPIYRPHVANKVMTIIDGQQRLSTFVMVNIALHAEITAALRQFQRQSTNLEPEHARWITEEATKELDKNLRNTFVDDQGTGHALFRHYPRIIRAYADRWARREDTCKYTSPIAKLIWDYICHCDEADKHQPNMQFKFTPMESAEYDYESHSTLAKWFKYIQTQVGYVRSAYERQDRGKDFSVFFRIGDLADSNDDASGLWDGALPPEVGEFIKKTGDESCPKAFRELFRLIACSRYVNNHLAITVVSTTQEEEAFDIFEALNTTGEPLTAFETFKPRVIEEEDLARYGDSPSKKNIDLIDEYLAQFRQAQRRQQATVDLLVHFALSETGKKLSRKFRDQRQYLRDEYRSLGKGDPRRNFVASLADLAMFFRNAWNVQDEKPSFEPLTVEDEEALFGFAALQSLKHTITIAPIFRFYVAAVSAESGDKDQSVTDLEAAIRATTAFSMLWRGCRGGTDGIDGHYRRIMSGYGDTMRLARRARETEEVVGVSLEAYRESLGSILRDKAKITSREDWIKRVKRQDLYAGTSRPVGRFLLFCASDDAIPDSTEPGLLRRGRQGIAPMFRWERWKDDKYLTIEHIAPQSDDSAWGGEIRKHPTAVNSLGNLILLPRGPNSVVSNRSWDEKRAIYRLLAAETVEEFERVKATVHQRVQQWSEAAERVVNSAKYLGMCKSIAQVPGDWTLKLIERRTERLAGLAWDRLAPWLGL